jgi:carbamoyl-phosphate synthase large subunit
MNILITSVGIRNYIIDYFKASLNSNGKIYAADCSNTAPAIYSADGKDYSKKLITLCKKNNIGLLISLIDPELSLLAKHKKRFAEHGIQCLVSNHKVIEICFDKYKTYQYLKNNGFPFVKTYLSLREVLHEIKHGRLDFPLIVKPRKGSASMGITTVTNEKELSTVIKKSNDSIIQEFMNGQEWGVDAYIDLISKKAISIFTKKKLKMRAGETDKAVSIKDNNLIELCKRLVESIGLIGPIDIDYFETKEGFVISEINPRFGGGYPLAYACGVDFTKMILNNIQQRENKPEIGVFAEDRFMFKYSGICIKRGDELT